MSKPKDSDIEQLAKEFDLTPNKMQEILDAVDDFEENFLSHLADSDKYELISTIDKYGNPLTEKQFNLLKRECSRLGLKCLYLFKQGENTLIINPKTLKMGIISEEVH